MDFVLRWSQRTGIGKSRLVRWLGIGLSKFYGRQRRYGMVNEHNRLVPRDFWLQEWEKRAIIVFYLAHQNDGYRRVTFMMLDTDVVAVSPSTTYRVLKRAGLLRRWNKKPSKKGAGFQQPTKPHQHWHVDICYINICGTFFYMCTILDGYSRFLVHWEMRTSMTEADVQIILQRAREKFPWACPCIISDNGPQFIAREFKLFIRICGMTHVRTSPFYPQSNGKLERFTESLRQECIRPKTPLSLRDGIRVVTRYVEHYNTVRLHSAIGYLTPQDKLLGRENIIFAERDYKLQEARERRRANRQPASQPLPAEVL